MKRWMLLLPLLGALTGCLQDTASYTVDARDHAITLVRNQVWPWESTVDVEVMVLRMPECNGGGSIKAVPEDAVYSLYRAPDEYPEPIFMLKVEQRVFAVSTQSCRLQEFGQMPDALGQELGQFKVEDGKFQFVTTGAAGKPGV